MNYCDLIPIVRRGWGGGVGGGGALVMRVSNCSLYTSVLPRRRLTSTRSSHAHKDRHHTRDGIQRLFISYQLSTSTKAVTLTALTSPARLTTEAAGSITKSTTFVVHGILSQ